MPSVTWRTIDIAPEDGSEILACFKGQFKWVYFITGVFHGQTRGDYAQATHWSPLPDPPEED